jgi:NAD(P)-dependent dehydrogenase (short-subunit alcohol dehydrogenase family)
VGRIEGSTPRNSFHKVFKSPRPKIQGDTMSTVLITGANRGLGIEFVKQYAADGWNVLATAREPEKAQELKQIASRHRGVSTHTMDIADDESIEKLVGELGGIAVDVMIHNSGIYPQKGQKFGEIDYGGWSEALETNLFGPMRLTEALIDNVAASERKQIAAISSSMASLRAIQGGSVAQAGVAYQYRTSKTALNMAMAVLATELASRGISVVMIDPGWVKTDMGGPNAQLTPEQSISGIRKVLAGDPMNLTGKFIGYDGVVRPW